MQSSTIDKLFDRRPFTENEHVSLLDLHYRAKVLAVDLIRVTSPGTEQDLALLKLRESLSLAELSIAMNPKCNKQVDMPFCANTEETKTKKPFER